MDWSERDVRQPQFIYTTWKITRPDLFGFAVLMVTMLVSGFSGVGLSPHAQAGGAEHSEEAWPAPPRTKRANDAYKVLSRHCAGCHQQPVKRRTTDAFASELPLVWRGRGPDNILELDQLAKHRAWVEPGLPDASALYNAMVMRHMSRETRSRGQRRSSSREGSGKHSFVSSITVEDLAAVRSWIRWLPQQGTCRAGDDGLAVSIERVRKDIDQYVAGVLPGEARFLRFVSFVHLAKACVPFERIKEYRSAMTHIFNSLSWGGRAVTLTPVDLDGLVVALDLRDLGWARESWTWLASQVKSPQRLGEALADETRSALGGGTPALSADAIAQAVLSTRVYNRLLTMPALANDLRERLRSVYRSGGPTAVTGVDKSSVTGGRRLVARHLFGSTGFMWEALDFKPRRSGSWKVARVRKLFEEFYSEAHGNEMVDSGDDIVLRRFMFRLPNGYPAFMLSDVEGARVERYRSARDGEVTRLVEAGFGCMSCHGGGVVGLAGDRFEFEKRDGGGEPGDVGLIRFGDEFLEASVANDFAGYARGLETGLGGQAQAANWVVALRDLVREHQRPLNLRRAAAELEIERNDLLQVLEAYNGPLVGTARQFRDGVVSRERFDQLALSLGYSGGVMAGRYVSANDVRELDEDGSQTRPLRDESRTTRLLLWSDKARYRSGDAGVIFAQADRDCRLVLVSIDRDGMATVLLPNAFDKNNLLKAGAVRSVPDTGAPYRLLFEDVGRETLVGYCLRPDVTSLPGLDHDFDAQQFTVVGQWTEYIGKAFEIENKAFARGIVPRNLRPRRRRGRSRASVRPDWLKRDRSRYMIGRDAIWISIAK